MMEYKITTRSERETIEIAQNFESEKFPNMIICLDGELGSGKTIFAKGIANALGINETITSPTFTIIKEYNGELPLYHMDVYRLDGNTEGVGIEEYFTKGGVVVIEWADTIKDILPSERLDIKFKIVDENKRLLIMTPYGKKYEDLCEQIYFFHEEIIEDLSVKILPLIDNALKECSLKINDIKKIYVTIGPGSFTGIRIGLTIMKVLAWSLNIEIIPLSSLELLASTKTTTDYIIPYIDARRGNCFIAIYDNDLNIISNDQFVNFLEFMNNIDKLKTYKIVTYDEIDNNNKIKPEIDVLKVINRHKNDSAVNPHTVNPNYLKLTEAEENLKKKND